MLMQQEIGHGETCFSVSHYPGTLTSKVLANPELAKGCAALPAKF